MVTSEGKYSGLEVAVIGMAGRFPGASDKEQLWMNLINGKETIRHYTNAELLARGINGTLLADPNFVKVSAYLDEIEFFDSAFFNYSEEDAKLLDPQVRMFHECVWEGLEDAGYATDQKQDVISLYAGLNQNPYWQAKLLLAKFKNGIRSMGDDLLTNTDLFTTLIANKLNLKGPAVSLNTACSTSLVAVHMACRGLLTGESNLAIAGGISINSLRQYGYTYEKDLIYSPDGHCRAFDEKSQGTVPGEGVGVVVLKKLDRAIKDGDHIYAVIKGSAINNDGKRKVGYAAPSVEGQAECILKAHRFSKVDPATISYIETHGTGTSIGDAIEIAALKEAFDSRKTSCEISSIKTNLGHLGEAAGVTGLIKAVFALKHKQIPATLHFNSPNRNINLEGSPFNISNKLKEWHSTGQVRRAGVSSFGIGGTNVHVVLEEAPLSLPSLIEESFNILTVSAKTETALSNYIQRIERVINGASRADLADLAYTLGTRRKHFQFRAAIVCDSNLTKEKLHWKTTKLTGDRRNIVFMFPGQGTQYIGMSKELYQEVPIYRQYLDEGFSHLKEDTGLNFKEIIFNTDSINASDGNSRLDTSIVQPLLFLVEYSMAKLIMDWGIKPDCMIGHSLGEYVAACISGVITFKDALRLVSKRGQLMSELPSGSMLSVLQNEEYVRKFLSDDISLAAVNGPTQCVLSGTVTAIDNVTEKLKVDGVTYKLLNTSVAFHSDMVEAMLMEFRKELSSITFSEPKIPFISNVSGKLISSDQAQSEDYWISHTRNSVLFSSGISTLLKDKKTVFIELGPAKVLTSLVNQHPDKAAHHETIQLLRGASEVMSDTKQLYEGLNKLWLGGYEVDWKIFYGENRKINRSFPTYPFDKARYPAEVSFSTDFLGQFLPMDAAELLGQEYEKNNALLSSEASDLFSMERPTLTTTLVAPVNPSEELLVRLFKRTLSINEVGTEDDFFELGGDSLKAMLLLKMIHKEFNVEISLKDFFKIPSVKKLDSELENLELLKNDHGQENEIII